ncbi:PrsW family intramembrane metalloprotease [Aestuariimicrobium soli]|uniref:PrsW family intramembrane metalloprotease n=1 Tax=Aestuariimicrobium soli TaxID=2035834 RepID=UPI003EBDFE25
MSSARLERRARILSGVPRAQPPRPWYLRLLRSPWTWALLVTAILGFLGLFDMYWMIHADREVEGGTVPGITNQSIQIGAKYAWPTAVAWTLLFLWFDRFRKNRIAMWLIALVWGACFSTWISIHVNSWAGELLSVQGNGDPSTGARPAVFVAPFVEEFSKATIVFALAVLVRYRIVSVMQSVCLAGLSAVGFAFTENILYYARGYEYASRTIEAGDAEQALMSLVKLRGIYTSFGHPFFTTLIAIGILFGLRHRSKLVRILAPITGFLAGALGHMLFNGVASVMSTDEAKKYWFMALAVVAVLAGTLILWMIREGGRVRARLDDLVRFGWLLPGDPAVYSSLRRRLWMLVIAVSQPTRLPATIRVMRHMTELAYLRDSMVLGLVDQIGYERARELLESIRSDRQVAVTSTAGERVRVPNPLAWLRARRSMTA